MELDVFDYVSFAVLGIITTVLVGLIVVLGSLPGKIAAQRNHPHAAAINAAAWISFLTLGALWPVAFVWAFLEFRPLKSTEPENPRP